MDQQENRAQVPGKSYLLGEYIVLEDGNAIIATFPPFFSLETAPLKAVEKNTLLPPFHPASAAGKFWQKEKDYFSNKELKFTDPYKGLGGFGMSTAEYTLLHRQRYPEKNPWEVRIEYRNLFPEESFPPSGADLIAQLEHKETAPQLHSIYLSAKKQNELFLPQNTELIFIHTGKKVATHTHLKELSMKPQQLKPLHELMESANSHWNEIQKTPEILGEIMKDYARILEINSWLASHTIEICTDLQKKPGVIGIKGCGALGADLVAILLVSNEKENFLHSLNQYKDFLHNIFDFRSGEWLTIGTL